MPIALTKPFFLLIWLFIPVIWLLINRSGLKGQPRRRRLLIGGLRTLLILLLGLALSHPRMLKGSDRVNLFFCLDLSESIEKGGEKKAMEFINRARSGMEGEDRSGLIVFGREPSLEISIKKNFELKEIQSQVDTLLTDISKALELAMARLPERGKSRIVLFSDGNENLGEAIEMAYMAGSLGIEIYPVPLDSWYQKSEVFIEDLWSPTTMPIETPFDIRLIVQSTKKGPADIILLKNGKLVANRSVELAPGKNVYRFVDLLKDPGLHLYKALINASSDGVFENNMGLSFTQGSKRPRVLYVKNRDGSGNSLIKALRFQGLEIVEKSPEDLPQSIQGYVDYSAIILDNVPAQVFSLTTMELFEKYVKDIGGGLVMIGGEQSFGAGRFLNTPVERCLPVFMDAPTKIEFPGLCLVLVIDKSSSMGGDLHGVHKLEGAKSAAFAAVELLNPVDQVGILAFDTAFHWTVPITRARERKRIAKELSSLQEGGGTDLFIGLKEAFRVLMEVSATKKHVIVLSDGMTVERDFPSLVRAMKEKKITVSTVAVGSDSDRYLLRGIAEWGGGRSYYTDDAENLPRIFTGETKVAAKKLIVEKDLQPRSVLESDITSGIPDRAFPKVEGLVLTYPKPGAQTLLDTTEGPLLVTWQYGLGRSVAFTSDLGGRWGKAWVMWDHYGKFVAQMVKWAHRKENPQDFSVKIDSRGEEGTFTVDVTDGENRFVNWLDLKLKVLWPSKKSQTISLNQTAPGMYRGNFPAHEKGEYYLTLFSKDKDGLFQSQTYGYGIPYTAEYENMEANHSLLKKLASISKGRVLTLKDNPKKLFQSDSTIKEYGQGLWPYLALAALILLIIDVATRKIITIRSN